MESLWARWSPQVAYNQREAPPALVEEMHGIARGAGVPFERIFLLNSMLDLNSFRYYELAETFCGRLLDLRHRRRGGHRQDHHRPDLRPAELHEKYVTVLKLKPAQGPRQLVFTFAGIRRCAGLNEAGIAVKSTISARPALPSASAGCTVSLSGKFLAPPTSRMPDAADRARPAPGGAHYRRRRPRRQHRQHRNHRQTLRPSHPKGNAIGHTNHYLADYSRTSVHPPRLDGSSIASLHGPAAASSMTTARRSPSSG